MPNSQVVPNYLVDFFFYFPHEAQTHRQQNQQSSFSSGISVHTSKSICLCEGVTKTATSVDQPALFIGFNHYIYISMNAFTQYILRKD